MKMISLECPKCGANLSVEKGRENYFCSYCGAKLLLHNENEYIHKNIDEAAVHRADNEHKYKMKQLEVRTKSKHRASRRIIYILTIIACAVVAILGLFLLEGSEAKLICLGAAGFIGFYALIFGALESTGSDTDWEEETEGGTRRLRIPDSVTSPEDYDYDSLAHELERLGFTNIETAPLYDLKEGMFRKRAIEKENMVDHVTINGTTDFDEEERVFQDVPITIYYHSFR